MVMEARHEASCPKRTCEKHHTSPRQKCFFGSGYLQEEAPKADRKQYKCMLCSKSFAQSISLKRHIRTHTGEKPFQCNDCGRRFTNSSHLTTHIRTHTGERPFQCDICGKKFSQHSGLHVHIRTHTGDKPYKCELCGKGFLDRSALKRHGSTHLNDRQKKRGSGGSSNQAPTSRSSGPKDDTTDDSVLKATAVLSIYIFQEYLATLTLGLTINKGQYHVLTVNEMLMNTLTATLGSKITGDPGSKREVKEEARVSLKAVKHEEVENPIAVPLCTVVSVTSLSNADFQV